MTRTAIEKVQAAIAEIRAGKMVILVDDEDRENEGDLVMAAEFATPEAVNFMARNGCGLICLPLTEERVRELDIPMMVGDNRSPRSTAFTVSIEARSGISTGISAADRAHTIRTAIDPRTRPDEIVSPGHVFPLKARPGGVLQRTGHTEGAIDLARLAGLQPAAVICEIMNPDGTMARLPDLEVFAKEHGLMILSIADLVEYRLSQERLVRRLKRDEVTMPSGKKWTAHVYSTGIDGDEKQFMALTHGEIDESPTHVRVHMGSILGDVFQVAMRGRVAASEAIAHIEKEGKGVVLYVPGGPSPLEDLNFYTGQSRETAPMEQGEVLREYGLGAQVLSDLGLRSIIVITNRPRRLPSLEGYGLEVLDQIVIGREPQTPSTR
ncbi:MAG: 3,4-dihydroxy-2-butanone-4-phosphate synthase [Sandaracinaceae bacterium]|nr:3,4-dihydroxy-2-butanone-4-phosphate synthase [Sandaracinaceae bacterium]